MPTPRGCRLALLVIPLICSLVPAGKSQDDPAVFRSESRLVVLHATIDDGNGNLITDLPQSAFRVFENGVEQEIKVFRREDVPVSMGLVLDDSASMHEKRSRLKSAIAALVQASHPGDELFIVNFNERPYLDTEFTRDVAVLQQGMAKLSSSGSTAMRDAVRLSIEHLWRRASEDKKVLLVVTDGEDNSSNVDLRTVVRAAQQNNIQVHAIALLRDANTEEKARARRDLSAMANASGGQAFYLEDITKADELTKAIAHVIRNQYTIAYSPSNTELDGTYRKIEIMVSDPRPMVIRSRTGYYATPESPDSTGGLNGK